MGRKIIMRKISLSVFIVVTIFMLIGCSKHFDLTVYVEDAQHNPIFGPSIEILAEGSGLHPELYHNTDCCNDTISGGRYHDVPKGDVFITIKKSGYQTYGPPAWKITENTEVTYQLQR
jgi:hypothetical protein